MRRVKATVLHFGELQQFLHHVGESAGFLEDNVQTPAQLSGIVVLQQCLAPTIDGRQGVRSSWDTEEMNSVWIFSLWLIFRDISLMLSTNSPISSV